MKDLERILKLHTAWLRGEDGGVQANLSRANLDGANLDGANLYGANLSRANLDGANLDGANLDGAHLYGANLDGANLDGANLDGANLYGANLDGANLDGANLDGANLDGANLPPFQLPGGCLLVWKKLRNGRLALLEIGRDVERTASLVGRKCRAASAKVLRIESLDGEEQFDEGVSGIYDESSGIVYRVGETVTPDRYDDDIRVECTHGIHFYATREEASNA